MFTSDTKKANLPRLRAAHSRKTAVTYLFVSIFTLIFGAVYEYFSYGVYSGYMVFMFMFPLAGGFLPYAVAAALGYDFRNCRLEENLYHAGLATLTVGSCVTGVLDIYGTGSEFTSTYWYAGFTLSVVGLIIWVLKRTARGRQK